MLKFEGATAEGIIFSTYIAHYAMAVMMPTGSFVNFICFASALTISNYVAT